jgi:hypothetical protein
MSVDGGAAKSVYALMVALVVTVAIILCVCVSAMAAGDVNTVPCPSETESSPGFHTYLPDCRAFELVTPAFVAGNVPLGVGNKREPPQVSADGEHLLSLVLGGFAETESLEQNSFHIGAYYEFLRTAAGWRAEALTPPPSLFPRYEFSMASSNFSRSLWALQQSAVPGEELPVGAPPNRAPEGVNGFSYPNNAVLAIREPAGAGKGRFTIVGPVTAPGHQQYDETHNFHVEGASADLSHILLRVNAELMQLWPGDETLLGKTSLYEYVGAGDREPVLVGVSNDGSVAEAASREGKAYINEAAELVSLCGTGLGGSGAGGPLASAVSASGEIVYFTALACGDAPRVNELYARVGGVRTVDISEPSTGPGGDCESCDESEPYPAVYQGASEDGSKVFFSSEQELLPGASGNSLYEYSFDAANKHDRVTLVAREVSGVAAVSEDGTRVYFDSSGVLSGGANENGEVAQRGAQNLYVYDTGSGGPPVFVAQEASGARATRDGQFLVFESLRHVSGTNDRSVVAQLFEYDADTGVIARVSVGQSSPAGYECETTHVVEEGFNCDGNATSGSFYLPYPLTKQESESWWPTDATSGLAVSANGVVEFESKIALTPLAVAGNENVYEYRAGDVYLLSPGEEATSPINAEANIPLSRALGVDESGQDAFFSTTESFLPQDTDSQTSWYDAREDGGYPAPAQRSACIGGACQGPFNAVPPSPAAGGSATAVAGGNVVVPAPEAKPTSVVKCKKGYVKKKGKCVKGPKAKSKATKAHAGRVRSNRRAGS